MNLYSVLEGGFPCEKNTIAIETHEGYLYTWKELESTVNRYANFLTDLGLPVGARIATQIDKSPEALFLYLATLKAGFVYLPLNTAYQAAEMRYFIGDARPSVVVCSPENLHIIHEIAQQNAVEHVFTLGMNRDGSFVQRSCSCSEDFETVHRQDDDLAALIYTSGTTGRSKGAMLSHANLISNAQVLHQFWKWQSGDVLLHALPIFHVHGLFVACHGALLNGSKMIWLPKFDVQHLIRHLPQATVLMGIPTFYVRLLAEPSFTCDITSNMRLFISGSAPLLTETFNAFKEKTGHTILERYGMSETIMLVSNPYDGDRVAGSVGIPLPGTELRIMNEVGKPCKVNEVGNIEVKGPNVFKGYWNMPEKTKEDFMADGWFKTGDMGRWGGQTSAGAVPDNYLCIVGRSRDLIISGGYNIYPKEIESYLDELSGVAESAVFGVPHTDLGEAVMAVIVPKPGFNLRADEIIRSMNQKIARFKVPKRIELVDELPRNAMGKVQKNLLRQQYSG